MLHTRDLQGCDFIVVSAGGITDALLTVIEQLLMSDVPGINRLQCSIDCSFDTSARLLREASRASISFHRQISYKVFWL